MVSGEGGVSRLRTVSRHRLVAQCEQHQERNAAARDDPPASGELFEVHEASQRMRRRKRKLMRLTAEKETQKMKKKKLTRVAVAREIQIHRMIKRKRKILNN